MFKKIISFCLLALAAAIPAAAQNGLENIVVEKFYVSNAADAANANTALSGAGYTTGTLPAGSVTWRIYADLLPGWGVQSVYGVSGHPLTFSTTTSFFNHPNGNTTGGNFASNSASILGDGTTLLDSYLSCGAVAPGRFGVVKTEDNSAAVPTGGGANLVINPNTVLANNDPTAAPALTTADGQYNTANNPSLLALTLLGDVASPAINLLTDGSIVGSSFNSTNSSWGVLGEQVGAFPTGTNRVLIGQFTTNGVFTYAFNIQIRNTTTFAVQNYVSSSPIGNEILLASLSGTLNQVQNTPPTISITAPAQGATFAVGNTVSITANAADANGSVTQVEFFVNGSSVGVDNTSPYSVNWTATAGQKNLTAVATDNAGATTTSSVVSITVSAPNTPPTVSITAPTGGATFTVGNTVAISATAADADGTVSQVQFFVNGVSVGTDNTSPYSVNWTATAGQKNLTAVATDNGGATTTSSVVSITVGAANTPPVVSLTAPTAGAVVIGGNAISIAATASDADGSVAQVEFFVGGVSVGVDNTAPYSVSWTSASPFGNRLVTAVATDNSGATTTSSGVSITVQNPAALPYTLGVISGGCSTSTFCLPVKAVSAVSDVIGYDIVIDYDQTKVTPTGVVVRKNDLLLPSFNSNMVSTAYANNAVTGKVNVSVFFNGTAPANARFSGTGEIICVEFSKTGLGINDVANFTADTLMESRITGVQLAATDAGSFTSFTDSLLTSNLKFWLDFSPIRYNPAAPSDYLITKIYSNNTNCNNRSTTFTQPDLNGSFNFNVNSGAQMEIVKDIASTTDVQPVVNGFDAFLTRRVLTNDATFVPSVYQMIAMDVNTDGVISAGDLSQINQRAVLLIPEFQQDWNYNAQGVSNGEPSRDWLFLDVTTSSTNPAYSVSSTYPSNDGVGYSKNKVPQISFCSPVPVSFIGNCPLIGTDNYIGVLLGDVNGNYASNNGAPSPFRTHSDRIVLDLNKMKKDGDQLTIPVFAESNDAVHSIDFSFTYDHSGLQYKGIEDVTGSMMVLGHESMNDATVRITSSSIQTVNTAFPALALRMQGSVSEITASMFDGMTGFINGEPVEIGFRLPGESTNVPVLSVYPNPAKDILQVFVSEDSRIELYDLSGRMIHNLNNVLAGVRTEIQLDQLADGMYVLKAMNGESVTTAKFIVKK